jgi:hypothetical protein
VRPRPIQKNGTRDNARQSNAYFEAKEQSLDGILPKEELAKYV